jgi:two-component system sensor histidine kinase ChiS
MLSPLVAPPPKRLESRLRELLVSLSILAVQYWQQTTLKSKVDLANESGIWTVTLDRGSPKTQTLDRYMSLSSLPRKANTEAVLRTVHFVLAASEQKTTIRNRLTAKLEAYVDLIEEHGLHS